MPRSATVAVIVGFAALASTAHAQVQQGRIAVRLPAYDNPVVLDTLSSLEHREDVTRRAVLFAVRKTFEDLEIPVTYVDSSQGIVMNAQLALTRRLGKYRMSQVVDCGNNLNGAIADQYRVRMAVAVMADSLAPSVTQYRVLIAAGAQSPEGVSRPPLACSTTGTLEDRIAKLVSARIWGS